MFKNFIIIKTGNHVTCFCTVRRDKNIHVIFFLRTGCWPSGGLMNAGKNLCFANSLLCFRASQELAIRYELFIVEDLMVTKMKNSNQSTVPLLG
jgi:hypothetical protein